MLGGPTFLIQFSLPKNVALHTREQIDPDPRHRDIADSAA
jgi:hypothetical protein